MENEQPTIITSDDGRSKRGRIMGKLFGRDRKASGDDSSRDLNDFLRGPSDTLTVNHAAPPVLAKLDISSAKRYPNALQVDPPPSQHLQTMSLRQRSHSPGGRNKKGLIVRFLDSFPTVIGYGGDQCDMPTVEIAKQKRSRPPPIAAVTAPAAPPNMAGNSPQVFQNAQQDDDPFVPGRLRRTQTGYSTISDATEQVAQVRKDSVAKPMLDPFSDSAALSHDEKRKSFIEVHQAQMRAAEGLAFANAVRSASSDQALPKSPSPPSSNLPLTQSPEPEVPSSPELPQRQPSVKNQPIPTYQSPPQERYPPPPQYMQPPESPDAKMRRQEALEALEQSPSSVYSTKFSNNQPLRAQSQRGKFTEKESGSPSSPSKAGAALAYDAPSAGAEEDLAIFVARTRHLFELFRLQSETIRPLTSCSTDELASASLWWFLIGRSALENTIRERPASPTAQRRNEMATQQAYANLAKGYWLFEQIIPELMSDRNLPLDPEVDEARQALVSNLRKLAGSMRKNGFLPPEEAMLPQVIDKSIWLEYPKLSQDVIALLRGSSTSFLAQTQQPTSVMHAQEALPLGDSPYFFCFGRVQTDVFLMEQGMESQRYYFSCILSIIRPQKQSDLIFIISSQNNMVQLRISGNKAAGPTWDDVRWRSDNCTMDIRLPRGFLLVVQCKQPDFRMLWNMYDYSAKVQSSLYPLKDEQVVFRSTLRSFQYFDSDSQSRQFPKEPVPSCEVALFERIHREGAATGLRSFHVGYRLAVVTGTRTKTLSGINQTFYPQTPVQYGFLRGEQNDPALSLRFENSRSRGNMVLSFQDEQERLRLHSLLVGTALHSDEQVYAEIPLQGVWFSEWFGDTNTLGLVALSKMPWQKVRIINDDNGGDRPACVLSDKLRAIFEFKDGMITDRINVAPGELKIRLDVGNPSCMMVFRQPQGDMTVAVTEAKVARETTHGLLQGVDVIQKSPTIRTYMFTSIQDLHTFQAAITGYKILFDGVASTFAISRRRMVVPIHKKWEAGLTRIQVVQQEGVTQLLAFFEDFSHGQCMGFTLKGTDVFECFGRSNKAGLKIDDAKFPLPKVLGGANSAKNAADTAFVCLDLPELPGEHDDISIIFDSEAGKSLPLFPWVQSPQFANMPDLDRDKLVACLPAPVKGSRLLKR